jgi:hypothetical protein
MGISSQDGGEQKSVAAGDVHDGANALEIVGIGNGRAIDHGYLGHRVVEDLSLGGILLQEFENMHAVNVVEGLLPGSHAIVQVRPAAPVPVSAGHGGEGAQAGSGIAAQNAGHRRLRKLSVGPFAEHTNAGGSAHQPVQRLRIRTDLARQLFRRLGSGLDEVRDTQLREAGDNARHVRAVQQLEHAHVCGRTLRRSDHLSFTWTAE